MFKIVFCYLAFLTSFGFAVDGCSHADAASTSGPAMTIVDGTTGPLGASDVTFTYGSQVPGNVPIVYVFTVPVVIRAHAKAHTSHGPTRMAGNVGYGVSHRRGALDHASVIARSAYRQIMAFSGDIAGAPQDVSGMGCETVGPRLDGTKVRICGGSVVGTYRADGSFLTSPWTDAGIY